MKIKALLLFALTANLMVSCNNSTPGEANNIQADSTVKDKGFLLDKAAFELTVDGKPTSLFVLQNHNGMQAAITNYGGRLVSLVVPGKNGKMVDVNIGFSDLQPYRGPNDGCFGAVVGRYGNRIAKARFTLDGVTYRLLANNGANTLHGGKKGFQAVVWDAKKINDSTLELSRVSTHMEEGFPGNLKVKVTYALTANNGIMCAYEAVTDKTTVVNLTNHAYFNLNGEGSGTILNHRMQIYADKYTPVDAGLIPTGALAPVAGTPFDFTQPVAIGARIGEDNEQLKKGNGYDHNFVLTGTKVNGLNHAATVTGDQSGIVMDVYTDEPGVQFYTGNFLRGANTLKDGSKDDQRTAFCLETQHFPDSPNQPSFPSTVLKPGAMYKTKTVYQFSIAP